MKIDPELVNKFLALYLERCKFRHAFAFLQFRKNLPNAKLNDLMEIFCNRKKVLLEQLDYIGRVIREGALGKKGKIKGKYTEESDGDSQNEDDDEPIKLTKDEREAVKEEQLGIEKRKPK